MGTRRRRRLGLLLVGIAAIAAAAACDDQKHSLRGQAAPPLQRRPEPLWSPLGWENLRWGMGPGDAVPRLSARGGETWAPNDEERQSFGFGTELAHAGVLNVPVHGQEMKALLKFSDSRGLFGVLLTTPPSGGMTRWRCSSVFEKVQAGLKNELGPGKDGITFVNGTPRTEWLSDTMRLKLTQRLDAEGCFVQMSYVDPAFYKD